MRAHRPAQPGQGGDQPSSGQSSANKTEQVPSKKTEQDKTAQAAKVAQ